MARHIPRPSAPRPSAQRPFALQMAALVLCGLALAGCPETGDSAKGAADDPLRNEAPVRIALHGDPASFDPHLQSEVIAQAVLGNVYDTLVGFDADMRLVPELAVNWSNPDEVTWRFDLRQGATFHDGRPVTAADVVASLERVRTHPRSRQAGSLVAVEEVQALDESTVELRTQHPYAVMLNKLAYVSIVPADAPDEITVPIGSGPYRFGQKIERQAGELAAGVRLERVDEDPRAAGRPRLVEYYFVAGKSERVDGLLEGRYDLVDDLGLTDLGKLQGRNDVRIESRSSLLVTYLQFDTGRPPFDDPRVRRAIDLAVDRDALVKRMFGGYAEPVGQMVSQNVFGYAPGIPSPRRDLTAARLLLEEAGYGDGLRVVLEHREGRAVAGPLREQLAEAGIEVELVPQPWSDVYQRLQTGEIGFYLGGWVCTSADAGDLFDAKVHTPREASGYGRANYSGYSNPELDELIEAANQTASVEQRGELWREGLKLLARELPYVPLYSEHETYGVRERIAWKPRQDGRIYGRDLRVVGASSTPARER